MARHFHPNATVHSSNLSAGISNSLSFLVLIFFKEADTQGEFCGSVNQVMD